TMRLVSKNTTIGNTNFAAGQRVLVFTAQIAHGLPRAQRPNDYDIHREASPLRHIWFGAGPHACVGMPLARAELVTAIRRLAAIGDLKVADRRYARRVLIPAYSRLRVSLS